MCMLKICVHLYSYHQLFIAELSFKMNISTILVSVLCLLFSLCSGQSWTTVPRWTDVYIRGAKAFENLDFKLGFLMDNYDIISLEKCLHDGSNTHITVM